MRNIIISLLLIFTFQSFAQNNFRKMSWGDSVSNLTSQYPGVDWEIETDGENKYYSIDDFVGGLKAKVIYSFNSNKLQMGAYYFMQNHTSNNLYYEDFESISDILNKKYDMEKAEEWNDTTWKGDLDNIGYALSVGDVEIEESYEDEITRIFHKISSESYGSILHILVYYDMDYVKSERNSVIDDF